MAAVWALANAKWGWAVRTSAMAAISYLIAPVEAPPRFGLDHEFGVDAPEFLATVAGASGTPFIAGNAVTLLNNGDAFYPAMLAAIRQAERSITVEAYIYWAGDIGREFADAFAERARSGCKVKLLLDAIGSASIGTDILERLEKGGCWITVGTTNFDNRSFMHNEESNVNAMDAALAQQLHACFLEDLGGCERLTWDAWRRRGVWARAQEFVAAFLQEQA